MAPAALVDKVEPDGMNIGAAKVVPAANVNPFPTAKLVIDVWPVPPREAGNTPAPAIDPNNTASKMVFISNPFRLMIVFQNLPLIKTLITTQK